MSEDNSEVQALTPEDKLQKIREYRNNYFRERYHSDPEFRARMKKHIMSSRSKKWKEYNDKQNEWRRNNLEASREYMRNWSQANRDKIKEARKKWGEKNKDKLKEYQQKWYKRNKGKIREYQRAWRQKRKEKRANENS